MKKNIVINIIGSLIIIGFLGKIYFEKNFHQEMAVYINDEYSTEFPKKGEALFSKAICNNDAKVSWNNDSWSLLINNLNQKTKCNLYFSSLPVVYSFDYTGSEQIFTAEATGIYKLEVWGAQGGSWSGVAGWDDETAAKKILGGAGGYASGYIKISQGQNIYISIGKESENCNPTGLIGSGPGGGGASYISLVSGNLKNLNNNIDKIIIVSGGGGGSEWGNGQGGSGGGYIGSSGIRGSGINTTGGTQTSGGKSTSIQSDSGTTNIFDGSFGQGGYSIGGDGGGQGGNGFYGGGASDFAYGGAGGSGYIGNPLLKDKVMYCYNCEESDEESTRTISTTCSKENPTSNCAKKGNGYARITLVGIDE